NFAINSEGNMATVTRDVTAWASLSNLRMDPYERALKEGGSYTDFLARQMWLFVPVGVKIPEFFPAFPAYPYHALSALNTGNINYGRLRQQEALERLKKLEPLHPT